MLWAIFSDVHSNGPALEAVLKEIDASGAERRICLGDLVGYGPHPLEVIQRIQGLDCEVLVGNHDLAAVGLLDAACFNVYAREAIEWTRSQLSPEHLSYLEHLPLTLETGPISAVHATHDDPEAFLYLQTRQHAHELMRTQENLVGVFGHTHMPLAFLLRDDRVDLSFESDVDLSVVDRALINVGSVGQPRDEDPRAAFLLFDDATLKAEIRRVEYDIDSVAGDMRRAGLPNLLAERLRYGV